MAINLVNIGASANDGSGDPIRTAFDTVNDNFQFINGGLFAGSESTIISAVSATVGYLVSNSYVLASTYVNAGSLIGNTVTSNGNLYVAQDGAYIIGNVTIVGNLNVSGTQVASQSQQSSSPITTLHYSPTPLILDDGKDIGLEFQYYKAGEQLAFLGWQNSSRSLVYLDQITDTANVVTAGTFGNVQFGQLLLSNTTAATSTTTGALQVKGGVGIAGNLHAARANVANLSVTGYHVGSLQFAGADTIYINGSPVQTGATAFNGGTVGLNTVFASTTQSTNAATGAVTVLGGLGVAGNVNAGNVNLEGIGSAFRGNIIGNVLTAAQPFVTSLGTLSSLAMAGTISAFNINPNTNTTYSLGSGTSNRWSKLWTFDVDMSGTLTGGAVNSTGGTHTGNIAINRAGVAALSTTTAVAELFNSGATTVRIGAGGTTEFNSNILSTGTTTGAVVVRGGVGIGGHLNVAGNLTVTGTVTGNVTGITAAMVGLGNVTNESKVTMFSSPTFTTQITTPSIVKSGTNAVGNIGQTDNRFNTVFATATSALYADLAENYTADVEYEPGTVVVFGGEEEITVTNSFADSRVAGVISTNPAYLMNAEHPGLPIALRGRVPVKVLGAVSKGDLLVTSSQTGCAQSVGQNTSYGAAIFAKSLVTDGQNGVKIIEAVIL
jgi:hypothetical protein